MTKEITYYLDGMMSFGNLSVKDQIWVFVNKPEYVRDVISQAIRNRSNTTTERNEG